MKKNLIHILAIFLITISSIEGIQAQNKPPQAKEPFISKLNFGGYIGLQFGTYTFINVSPVVSYRATHWLYPGIGFTYMYSSYDSYGVKYTESIYGPKVFVKAYVWRDLFAHVEYEALNVEQWDVSGVPRTWINNIFLGAGYRQWLGQKAFMSFSILYNINDSMYSPYRNPVIRIGFGGSF